MKMQDKMVAIDEISLNFGYDSGHVVVLKEDAEADRELRMSVGAAEFVAIAKEKGLVEIKRPLTHELYLSIMEKLHIEFLRVEISSMKKDTFYASVMFRFNGTDYTVESRPSDAMALALNRRISIMVNKELLHPRVSREDIKEYRQFIKRAEY